MKHLILIGVLVLGPRAMSQDVEQARLKVKIGDTIIQTKFMSLQELNPYIDKLNEIADCKFVPLVKDNQTTFVCQPTN